MGQFTLTTKKSLHIIFKGHWVMVTSDRPHTISY